MSSLNLQFLSLIDTVESGMPYLSLLLSWTAGANAGGNSTVHVLLVAPVSYDA